MAATTSPSRTPVVLTLLAAAVIGFLVGALIAVTVDSDGQGTDTNPLATSGPTATPTPGTDTPTAPSAAVDSELTLTADRARASTDELIRLSGVLRPGAGGVELQVQQSVDGIGFVDFPVTATTRSDGSFGIWVRTGRVGTNEFRMVSDTEGGQVVSNPVTVEIS